MSPDLTARGLEAAADSIEAWDCEHFGFWRVERTGQTVTCWG